MNRALIALRRLAGRIVRGAHPRSIAWEIKHARKPTHPLVTSLGWEGGLKVRIYSNDVIGRAVYQKRVSESGEVRVVLKYLKQGMTFVDAGANFGQYTILAAHKVGSEGHVHSFEPNTRMFRELTFNVELNGLSAVCTLNETALADRVGTAKMSSYEPGAEVYGSMGSHQWQGSKIIGYDEIPTTTLDRYLIEHKVTKVDLIKMDIEGAELLALQGATDLLRRKDAPALLLEMVDKNTVGLGYSAMNVWDYLEALGYRLHSFNARGTLSPALKPPEGRFGHNFFAVKNGH